MGSTAAPSKSTQLSRRILLVSTVGGSTNAAPILEIGRVLHARGHTVDFATLEGGQKAGSRFPYLNKIHILGRGFTPEEDEEVYSRASRFTTSTIAGRGEICFLKTFLDSFWEQNYPTLKKLVTETHFDFIFSDYQNDASKDIMVEHNIPLAQMWPQAPLLMARHPWIPGEPFMQQRCLTSETASVSDRLFETANLLRCLPWLAYALLQGILMRRRAGVKRMIKIQKKPDHLVMVNSFFGLEVPKDIPPLMSFVGPVLSDEFSALDKRSETFLRSHRRTAFVALGTHVRLSFSQFERLFAGLANLLEAGELDGIIWAMQKANRKQIDLTKTYKFSKSGVAAYGSILNNVNPHMLFVDFAPQRAVLSHPSTRIFVTHCGASSANEGAFHGVPMLTLAFYSDQIPGALRLRSAGVALSLDKFTFTPAEVREKVNEILRDADGSFARNCLRLQRIAQIASRGKERAADLIEEHMYDHELRFDTDSGRELRAMHLQTADARMSAFRANNWDLILLGAVIIGGLIGLVEAIRHASLYKYLSVTL